MLIPEGKIGNYVKGMFSILVILVIVKPMFTIVETDYNFQNIFSENAIVLQEDFLNFTNDKKIQNIVKNCEEILKELGIENAFVDIDYDVSNYNQINITMIKVNLKNSVIISDKEHMYIIEDIKSIICKYLSVNSDKVIIYE